MIKRCSAVRGAAAPITLASVLCLGAVPAAIAAGPDKSAVPARLTAACRLPNGGGAGGWAADGLRLSARDNRKANDFLVGACRAERSISPQVAAAARLSQAQLVGFQNRLKSPDSLKRKIATRMQDRGTTAEAELARLTDAVRYTLQWNDRQYTGGVTIASAVLAGWGNTSNEWKNSWAFPADKGYPRVVNSSWKAPAAGQLFEIQFHTRAGKQANLKGHVLYEEERLPRTSPERKAELHQQQAALYAKVPVPAGAPQLAAPPAQPSPELLAATG